MALNRINADSIADGTVVAADILDGTITLAKLASGTSPSAAANGAFLRANNSLNANAGGTITGNVTFSYPVILANTVTIGTGNTAVSLGAGNATVFKNRIINGDMRIDQRNAGASVTPTNGALTYTVDRFACYVNQASKLTAQQSTTAPSGFINSFKITSSSAYTVGSGDRFIFQQAIEGLNIADLGWGTASAKTVTLSFQVYSSLTGTFGGSLKNNAGNRSYPFSYTISSANTWTSISVTVVGDTTGTWLTDNNAGMTVCFGLGTGTTFSGTAGSWAAANYDSATGATSVVGTSGATFYITGVQLEVGSSATGFEYVDYTTQLILCQRYYTKTFSLATVPAQAATQNGSLICTQGAGGGGNGNSYSVAWQFKAAMRTAPTIALYTPTVAGGGNWFDSGGGSATTSGASNTSEFSTTIYNISAAGNVNTNAVIHATASAEL